MIYITPEGHKSKVGINFYPLSRWRYTLGFRVRFKSGKLFMLRAAFHVKKFYCYFDETATWSK